MSASNIPILQYQKVLDITELPRKATQLDFQIYNDLFSCLYIPSKKNTNRTYVFLNGACTSDKAYPIFQRWTWHNEFDGNCLYIFDPMLYHNPNTNLAWYAGKENYNFTIVIKSIVLKITELNQTPPKNVTFYGSSGGGFAAIATAARYKGSTAIAINPQVKICNYSPPLVRKYSDFAFPNHSYEQFRDQFSDQNDLLHIVDTLQPSLKVLYYQNILDFTHFKEHMVPFAQHYGISALGGASSDNSKRILLFEDEKGHAGESKSNVNTLLKLAQELS